LITDDWKVVLGEGTVMTADQILVPLKEGKLKFSSFTVEDLDIRIYTDTAVVIGINHTKGEWDGQEFIGKSRFTDVFIRTGGKWRCVSSHSTDIANR
jgi:ketosteroid isomerase-like protein